MNTNHPDTRTTTEASVKALKEAIENMDGLSREGFGQIASIARLALYAMESPTTAHEIETYAVALETIWGTALRLENCINAEAEAVGCNCVDEAEQRRRHARKQRQNEEVRA
ncbi:hypothetical protein PIGHUM_04007 [Pigmentiphaga humi]|uniref:Uncharacterized protein n=1 Tax=Pigmentiphaga humi TaxID=2478468 RepID=A0A3P4B8S4_9BURK|nr:hypothetical protein [Pigmentiphaga humi]VCU71916.1 hypothetical protein PIGHUM_04007 [Pigmentiphaga humi]